MATVFFASGARLRSGRDIWVRHLISVLVAVVIAAVLCWKDAEAQTMGAMVPTSGVSWSNAPSSTPASASVSSGSMTTTTQAVTSLALAGLAVAVPWTRVATVGASVMGAAGRMALQTAMSRGALTGAALTAALALSGDTKYDQASNSFLYSDSSKAYRYAAGYFVDDATGAFLMPATDAVLNSSKVRCETAFPGMGTYGNGQGAYNGDGAKFQCINSSGKLMGWTRRVMPGCDASSVKSGTSCVPKAAAATNAQIEASIAATPASWSDLFNAAGCPQKANTYIDLVQAASSANSDPCAVIVTGGTGSSVTVSPTNNPYGWPSKQWSEAYNGLTHNKTLEMSTAVSANTGADAKANPVQVQTTAKETDVAKDAAGNTTTNVTTTTAPAETKPADKTDDTTSATFNAGEADLYTKKSKTWNDVIVSFSNVVKGAPWYAAAVGFFNVSIAGGACPHWTVAATKWTPVMDAGQYVCSQNMLTLYGIGGTVVLIVAAWAAFRIAFL